MQPGLVENLNPTYKRKVFTQVVAACQFVYEEKFIRKYNIPALKVVGLEGNF